MTNQRTNPRERQIQAIVRIGELETNHCRKCTKLPPGVNGQLAARRKICLACPIGHNIRACGRELDQAAYDKRSRPEKTDDDLKEQFETLWNRGLSIVEINKTLKLEKTKSYLLRKKWGLVKNKGPRRRKL